jgi:hypothetical protein
VWQLQKLKARNHADDSQAWDGAHALQLHVDNAKTPPRQQPSLVGNTIEAYNNAATTLTWHNFKCGIPW